MFGPYRGWMIIGVHEFLIRQIVPVESHRNEEATSFDSPREDIADTFDGQETDAGEGRQFTESVQTLSTLTLDCECDYHGFGANALSDRSYGVFPVTIDDGYQRTTGNFMFEQITRTKDSFSNATFTFRMISTGPYAIVTSN